MAVGYRMNKRQVAVWMHGIDAPAQSDGTTYFSVCLCRGQCNDVVVGCVCVNALFFFASSSSPLVAPFRTRWNITYISSIGVRIHPGNQRVVQGPYVVRGALHRVLVAYMWCVRSCNIIIPISLFKECGFCTVHVSTYTYTLYDLYISSPLALASDCGASIEQVVPSDSTTAAVASKMSVWAASLTCGRTCTWVHVLHTISVCHKHLRTPNPNPSHAPSSRL